MLKPIIARIPAALAKRAKLAAVQREIPFQQLVAAALENYLRKEGKP